MKRKEEQYKFTPSHPFCPSLVYRTINSISQLQSLGRLKMCQGVIFWARCPVCRIRHEVSRAYRPMCEEAENTDLCTYGACFLGVDWVFRQISPTGWGWDRYCRECRPPRCRRTLRLNRRLDRTGRGVRVHGVIYAPPGLSRQSNEDLEIRLEEQ